MIVKVPSNLNHSTVSCFDVFTDLLVSCILRHTKHAISKMAVNSNTILLLKFQMSARNKQPNIPPSTEMYYFAEDKSREDFLLIL